MKRFLNIGHVSNGAGAWGAPIRVRLKAAVLILLFLAQVSIIPVFAQGIVSTVPGGQMTEMCLSPGINGGVTIKLASVKKNSRKIKNGNVTLSKSSCKYDGHTKKPSVTVMFGHKKLKKNRDYTVTYKNNRQRGTAKVNVKGKGLYRGTVIKTFRIR